ncbi:hypothetical protein [Rufibacter hautae]|uniref:Uncharacterized protein n=1 Tax=Rufibacter hautae TaxID=2595005 RepID=A0A5B6TLX9_9BACT|nr:hypothetical protein [Rufibacter hautae]KAA3440480.1 hypothetical protein FOA19_07455 [Rufibacter hautae]
MQFAINILQTVVGVIIAYFILRKLTGNKDQLFRAKFFKYLLGLFLFVFALTALGTYLIASPEIVEQAVEQLKQKPEIQTSIGEYTGYGYNTHKIEQIHEFPSLVELSLSGSKADVKLSVLIDSTSSGFEVKEYQILDLEEK